MVVINKKQTGSKRYLMKNDSLKGQHRINEQIRTTVYSKEGYKLDIQKAIKDIVSVPVLGDGNLKDPEVAKKAVEDGILDYVGLALSLIHI